MLAQIVTENGVKKIQALTADTGVGAPVGSYLYLEKKSNPQGYLYCDGSTFDETVYPALYQYLGTNVLPDWREFSAVGAEQNTTNVYDASTNPTGVIHDHDVYAEGESKDDQLQNHKHALYSDPNTGDKLGYSWLSTNNGGNEAFTNAELYTDNPINGRVGDVTRGKRKAVFIYIKATSGLTENQQENVLNTINENLSYSTEEHATGKKWIDGKDIYSLVIPINNQVSVLNNYDLTDKNIEWVTKSDVMIYNDNKQHIETNLIDYNVSTKKLVATSQLWCSYAIIEYTKTTD